MKSIGMFGGSFNPPHMGHLIVCESIRSLVGLDKVLLVPSAQPPHKKDVRLAPAEMRLEMTRLAIQDNPQFEVSDIEVVRGGTSFTVDTLKELHRRQPGDRFFLIIGADNWTEFDTWREPEQIMDLADIIVMTRPGFTVDRTAHRKGGNSGRNVRFVDVPQIAISGTMIRLNIKSGRSIRYLVPRPVEDYIAKHALYHEIIR